MTSFITGRPDPAELEAVRAAFGVADIQVRRDHVISHALAAIASIGLEEVVFFGGTALCRTHLPNHRLSEDIDLVALGDRRMIASWGDDPLADCGRRDRLLRNGARGCAPVGGWCRSMRRPRESAMIDSGQFRSPR